jgi:hypothetical protein
MPSLSSKRRVGGADHVGDAAPELVLDHFGVLHPGANEVSHRLAVAAYLPDQLLDLRVVEQRHP